MDKEERHIILFDGVCNLCNSTVQFLIKRDSNARFKYASLQSKRGQELLKEFQLSSHDFETFVYINGNRHFLKSSAALQVLKELGGVWSLFYAFILIPKKMRDMLYTVVVQNRYRWFGKRDTCMVPTPELRNRFLQD